MPPRIPRASVGWTRSFRTPNKLVEQHICPICSISQFSQRPRTSTQQRKSLPIQIPVQKRCSSSSQERKLTSNSKLDRTALHDALLEIQKNATNYVNISRLQLALRGLEQPEGEETIRIAILGLADGGASLKRAKELLRLILADPLKEEEEWERSLIHNDNSMGRPLLVRVGHSESEGLEQSGRLVHELNVSSPMFNGHKLEILILEMDPPMEGFAQSFEENVLVPTMEIPTSSTGRYTPVTTPVHKAFILGQGIMGAASLLSYPVDVNRDTVGSAVNLRISEVEPLPIQVVDIAAGSEALLTFRKSVNNAMSYEHQWFSSGIPSIIDWMKSGTSSTQNTVKPPLLNLITSITQNADKNLDAEHARQLSRLLSNTVTPAQIATLRHELSAWSERAHTELRDQLDVAFGGQKWRKLGWWKLFWRVDDVSMMTSDMLSRRFLIEAEKEIIFLAGRIEEAGIYNNLPLLPMEERKARDWAYKPVEAPIPEGVPGPKLRDLVPREDEISFKPQPWPLHIPVTRSYLSTTTIPALQALAQKLVLQTLSTSTVSSALAGLIYVSSLSTTMYEAGAVAALGIVWSMRRMQNKWETARKYWEGEVREEGRKAVRSIDTIVGDNLKEAEKGRGLDPIIEQDLERARAVIRSADSIIR